MEQKFKKRFIELPDVEKFMGNQKQGIFDEYTLIKTELQINGMLSMPKAEKIKGRNLFAIRVMQAGNVRIFYTYGKDDIIWGIHAYTKKTQQIPEHELKYAGKMVKILKQKGWV